MFASDVVLERVGSQESRTGTSGSAKLNWLYAFEELSTQKRPVNNDRTTMKIWEDLESGRD
jgi:hypothetical protein